MHWIRKNPKTYQRLRNLIMLWKRWRYGLRGFHPTAYMIGRSRVSKDLVAHEYVSIGKDCWFTRNVELGAYVIIAPKVAIVGSDHRIDCAGMPIIFSGRPESRPTVIERDVWLGYRSTIISGVTVGRGSVVAAGAVVTKDVEPYSIVAGIPATKIGERFADTAARAEHDARVLGPIIHGGIYETD